MPDADICARCGQALRDGEPFVGLGEDVGVAQANAELRAEVERLQLKLDGLVDAATYLRYRDECACDPEVGYRCGYCAVMAALDATQGAPKEAENG